MADALKDCIRTLCTKSDNIDSAVAFLTSRSQSLLNHPETENAFFDDLVALTAYHLSSPKGSSKSFARELKKICLKYAVSRLKSSSDCYRFLNVIGSLLRPDVFILDNFEELSQKLSERPLPDLKEIADGGAEQVEKKTAVSSQTVPEEGNRLGELFTRYAGDVSVAENSASEQSLLLPNKEEELLDELCLLNGSEVILTAFTHLPEMEPFLRLLSSPISEILQIEDFEIVNLFMEKSAFLKNISLLLTSLGPFDNAEEPCRIAAASALAATLHATSKQRKLRAGYNLESNPLETALQIPSTLSTVVSSSRALSGLGVSLCVVYQTALHFLMKSRPNENVFSFDASAEALADPFMKTAKFLFNFEDSSERHPSEEPSMNHLLSCPEKSNVVKMIAESFCDVLQNISVFAFDAAIKQAQIQLSLSHEPELPKAPPLPPRVMKRPSILKVLAAQMEAGEDEIGLREMFEGTGMLLAHFDESDSSTEWTPPPLPSRDKLQKRLIVPVDETETAAGEETEFQFTAERFMELAVKGFQLLNEVIADWSSSSVTVSSSLREFFNKDFVIERTANLIRKLDNKTDIPESLPSYSNFSNSVGRLLQALMTKGIWTEESRTNLLALLGVNLKAEGATDSWPLCLAPRTLGLLAHHLIDLQQEFNKKTPGIAEPCCKLAWERLISTLEARIVSGGVREKLVEDLNVEQMQLFQLLFESFGDGDRKDLFSKALMALTDVSASAGFEIGEAFPLLPSRLLLIIDFMQLCLNPAAPEVTQQTTLDQVAINLFKPGAASGLMPAVEKKDIAEGGVQYVHFPDDMESCYAQTLKKAADKKDGGWIVTSVSPLFYDLHPEVEVLNLEVPALFYFGYDLVHRVLIRMLLCGSLSHHLFQESVAAVQALHSACYCFSLTWRLLETFIPPLQFFKTVLDLASFQIGGTPDLCMVIVALDAIHKLRGDHWTWDNLVVSFGSSPLPDDAAKSVIENVTEKAKDTISCLSLFQHLLNELLAFGSRHFVSPSSLPPATFFICIDAVLTSYHVMLNEICDGKSDSESIKNQWDEIRAKAQETLPVVLNLLTSVTKIARAYLVGESHLTKSHTQFSSGKDEVDSCDSDPTAQVLMKTLAIGKVNRLSSENVTLSKVPEALNEKLAVWENVSEIELLPLTDQPHDVLQKVHLIRSLLLAYNADIVACSKDCYYSRIMKHMMVYMTSFTDDLLRWCFKDTENDVKDVIAKALLPLTIDASAGFICKTQPNLFELILGSDSSESYKTALYNELVAQSGKLMMDKDVQLSPYAEDILADTITLFGDMLDKPLQCGALVNYFGKGEGDLVGVLLTSSLVSVSTSYRIKLLKFFNKLLSQKEKTFPDLSAALQRLDDVEEQLHFWLRNMLTAEEDAMASNSSQALLSTFIQSLVKDSSLISEAVSLKLLNGLISLGPRIEFDDFFPCCIQLASFRSGEGHVQLFAAVAKWLGIWKGSFGEEKDALLTIKSMANLLKYVSDVMIALKYLSGRQAQNLADFGDADVSIQDVDSDYADDGFDDDLGGESTVDESDGEDALCNQLCTFTVTQKEFMHQHWYHCHTCNMVDGLGVCTICAKVCHRDHDLSYAKCGSFFCDCGAKEDGGCKALVRRLPGGDVADQSKQESMSASQVKTPTKVFTADSGRREQRTRRNHRTKRRNSAETSAVSTEVVKLANKIKSFEKSLQDVVNDCSLPALVFDLIDGLLPSLVEVSQRNQAESGIGFGLRELDRLHNGDKAMELCDNLTTATLSSQEGAFENVKLSYGGEQGQAAKRFIGANVLTRVAMCALGSAKGKNQFLLICHDKGKLTLLQLSSLLKQAESSKKKLTLARLSSSSVPFTVITAASNPCNDECVALCGLAECQVLTFNASGSVSDHLVLHPSLDPGKCILKPIWLPGSQTQLAIVTVDFIKIYDLSVDAISPSYYFLLPAEKIRDATFICSEKSQIVVVMTTQGNLYIQNLEESNRAQHGPFYLTVQLSVDHEDLKEVDGDVGGGGLSVYFSHVLQLLFFSYGKGLTYAASLNQCGDKKEANAILKLFPILYKSGGRNLASLTDWSDVRNHPGLLMSLTHPTGTPVMVLVEPNKISVQEFKNVSPKAKVLGMISVRHGSGVELPNYRTTTIVLCEDGSLRIYLANNEKTSHWLSSAFRPTNPLSVVRTVGRRRAIRAYQRAARHIRLPVDFFEGCQPLSEVEFGGKDILHVYNSQQVKIRLNTQGTYLACTKPTGFDLDVINVSATSVIVGVRVQVGCQSVDKAPSYFEVFGRQLSAPVARTRWCDIPFTKEEIQLTAAAKKFTLKVGPSLDPNNITMIDCVKVYGKTKEECGWSAETLEDVEQRYNHSEVMFASSGLTDPDHDVSTVLPKTEDKMMANCLQILDGCFADGNRDQTSFKEKCYSLATQLLTASTVPLVLAQTKALLASFHSSREDYHKHKDEAQLTQVFKMLDNPSQLNVESFQKGLVLARGVGIARPANLLKFIMSTEQSKGQEGACWFIEKLMSEFWVLYADRSMNPALAPVCNPGLTRVDTTVTALVEILHALVNASSSMLPLVAPHYIKMLFCEDRDVSFTCNHALVYTLRPRKKRKAPPPEATSTASPPSKTTEKKEKRISPSKQLAERRQEHRAIRQRVGGPALALPPSMAAMMQSPESVEAMAAGLSGVRRPPRSAALEHMLHVAGMVDDDAMMELAIQLSLQEQGSSPPSSQPASQQSQSGDSRQPSGASQRREHPSQGESFSPEDFDDSLSQSTLSGSEHEPHAEVAAPQPPASDELLDFVQGPPELLHGEELYGEVEEVVGVLDMDLESALVSDVVLPAAAVDDDDVGESQAEGSQMVETSSLDDGGENAPMVDEDDQASSPSSLSLPAVQKEKERDDQIAEVNVRLHSQRLELLKVFIQHVPELRNIGGMRSVPYFQVVLYLCSLIGSGSEDSLVLDELVSCLADELNLTEENATDIFTRTAWRENQVLIWRLLSVLMSKEKPAESQKAIQMTVRVALLNKHTIQHCLKALQSLLGFWKENKTDLYELAGGGGATVPGALLKPRLAQTVPDLSPFFIRQYSLSHAKDVFECYPLLVTELLLRIPYQIRKLSSVALEATPKATFGSVWKSCLAQYMLAQQSTQVRRQVRKLLLSLSGSKEKYRELRDLHLLAHHMQFVRDLCDQGGFESACLDAIPLSLPYDILLTLYEHVKACSDVAVVRTASWQLFCEQEKTTLPFLLHVSLLVPEGIVGQLFQLLTSAVCGVASVAGKEGKHKKDRKGLLSAAASQPSLTPAQSKKCRLLGIQLMSLVNAQLLTTFVRSFLFESNNSRIRWQTHLLLTTLNKLCNESQKGRLTELLWSLWPDLPSYGRKAGQFVDLLSCFIAGKSDQVAQAQSHSERAVQLLKTQNSLLACHRNSHIYTSLQGLVEFDGYYLESDPCFVCNNPEVAYSTSKLSSLKSDMKFTTTCQLVKLSGSYNISKFVARISDVRRTKMVRTVNLYYNNRTVQSVIELKNKRSLWKHAKTCRLSPGQTDLKVDFPLPIVACNFVIEFTDFYDNYQASSETLQCPRCSAQVHASPGICGNCGENVFQCHKCRSINYDEKDPFLCISCGYCKFARFDFAVTSRSCCAVDPIENEEDRQKAHSTINSLLERADKVYKQLVANREPLDILLSEVGESVGEMERAAELEQGTAISSISVASSGGGGSGGGAASKAGVNKIIQGVARRYCVDCKTSFEELSKIMQKVLACRKEIIEFDHQQLEKAYGQSVSTPSTPLSPLSAGPLDQSPPAFLVSAQSRLAQLSQSAGATAKPNCYGCMSAATEHCVALLRALASQPAMRRMLIKQGLIQELVDCNLRRGTVAMRREVRALLCLLSEENASATRRLNRILLRRIKAALDQHKSNSSLVVSIQHEIRLLMATVGTRDSCWEDRLRSVFKLFVLSNGCSNPVVMEHITLPCFKVLLHMMRLPRDAASRIKDRKLSVLPSVGVGANAIRWLEGDPNHKFVVWKKRTIQGGVGEKSNADRLAEKYGNRWISFVSRRKAAQTKLSTQNWLRRILFSPSSKTARQVACTIVESLCKEDDRRRHVLDLLFGCLGDFGEAGQNGAEFLKLYQTLSAPEEWKNYLALKGILPLLGRLITKETKQLAELEQRTLSSDLSQGCALKMLTELLASFIQHSRIRQQYKGRLVGTILNGFLSLKRLVVQRTKLIDDTQDLLLQLLGDMTSGTEAETKAFIAVCIDTLNRCPLSDMMTPVFIFERLCSIIYPEEEDSLEFYLILEKDPAQEEFLQGRMQGNPYTSKDPGLGPSMRDIKNRICTDCELVALLEDDTGMELLVKNKIISLDLPVKEVHKRIWCKDGESQDKPMRVVYRMRGLMGEATEDMINSFDNEDQAKDEEEVYRLSAVLSDCAGLNAMLSRLSHLGSIIHGRQLIAALLKLMSYCVKVKVNREYLAQPGLNSLNIMLAALNKALRLERDINDGSGAAIAEHLLLIIEAILLEASALATSQGAAQEMPTLSEDQAHLAMLLDFIESPYVKSNASVLQAMVRLIPFLTYGDESRMQTLIEHFSPHLDFDKFDTEQGPENRLFLDCFCNIADGIVSNAHGAQLKDLICDMGMVDSAVQYVVNNMPARPASGIKPADDKPFLDFLARPSLPYILRILTGLCKRHHRTQLAISGHAALPSIHRLEQVSTEGSVGTLAENLIEALRDNPDVAAKIDEVRRQTRAEKKRLAMAMRQKQLGALGMAVNEKGLLVPSTQIDEEMKNLVEETGLRCCICREGYKNQPKKALGIYTFTKRMIIDEFESKPRKTPGCSTVTHFNVVHYDCHYSAIKHSKSRDEWENAFLYNANSKCNGLMPIWGPEVSESLYVSNLARYSTNLSECTGLHDISFTSVVRDLRLLLLRFAHEQPFSAETGGGGGESNIHFIPYLISAALYRVGSARGGLNIDKQVAGFLKAPKERRLPMCYELDGPLECTVLSLFVYTTKEWKAQRTEFLPWLILLSHVRHESQSPPEKLASSVAAEYTVYKPLLMLFAMVDMIHCYLKPEELSLPISTLCSSWLDWLRRNDQAAMAAGDKMLDRFQKDFLPAESFTEFCQVAGLSSEIEKPDEFLADTLNIF